MQHPLGFFYLFVMTVLCACFPQTEPEPMIISSIFQDHMVLQRDTTIKMWGTADPGTHIEIQADWGETESTICLPNGEWRTQIKTGAAGGPYTMEISTSDTTLVLRDILLGEVWLASGQSNMEMPMTGFPPLELIEGSIEALATSDDPSLRMLNVVKHSSITPKSDIQGLWQVATPESGKSFSATAYFFARKLRQELNVPVGIIHASWGGTVAEAWMSPASLKAFPHHADVIDHYDARRAEQWIREQKRSQIPKRLLDLEMLDSIESAYAQPDYSDSAWASTELPLDQCRTPNFIPNISTDQAVHGAFWYRKTFSLEAITDYTLEIQAIDDADVIYINGKQVGATWNWSAVRRYPVPAKILHQGVNSIAIQHYDGGGGSHIHGPIRLVSDQGHMVDLSGMYKSRIHAELQDSVLLLYDEEAQRRLAQRPEILGSSPNEYPSSLYQGMISPIVGYGIRGAIWYQGESNVGRATEYASLFPALIQDWRGHWGAEFPFYFVQIAPYDYGGADHSAWLREAQRRSTMTARTDMVVNLDLGHQTHIHPGNKAEVGKRLAALALYHDYGRDTTALSPRFRRQLVRKGNILLEFDRVGDGLVIIEADGPQFEIAGADGVFYPAFAKIDSPKRIVLESDRVAKPLYARYAWKDYVVPTVYNSEGLPLSSFTTEAMSH